MRRVESIVWGERGTNSFSQNDWHLYRAIGGSIQTGLLPRLAAEETTLIRGVSIRYLETVGKATLLNISGNYLERDRQWYLYFTIERVVGKTGPGVTRQYRTVRIPIRRTDGHLDWTDKIHTYAPETIDDTLWLVHVTPNGTPVPISFRRSFLGDPNRSIQELMGNDERGVIVQIRELDPWLFHAWGRDLDQSPLTRFLATHNGLNGGRLPLPIRNMRAFLERDPMLVGPPTGHPGIIHERGRVTFQLSEAGRAVPWAKGRDTVMLEVVYDLDDQGRYVRHQLLERSAGSVHVGLHAEFVPPGRGPRGDTVAWTGRSSRQPHGY
jgi:hypothetical protein